MQAEAHDQDVSECGAQERLRCAGRPFRRWWTELWAPHLDEEYGDFDIFHFDVLYLAQDLSDATRGISIQ